MRRVPKLVLSALVALSVSLGVAPATALAGSVQDCSNGKSCTQHEAAIGTTHYDTIEEAITAANNNKGGTTTIELLQDATMGANQFLKNQITLILDGSVRPPLT